MENTFNFGKIAFNGTRKINSVDVTIRLREIVANKLEFTASGNIWNSKHTDCVCGGQCLDTIAETEVGENPIFKEIYRLWKRWHLNAMHAGTPKQEEALNAINLTNYASSYKECCEYLDSIGLLEDNGYVFGTGWLYEEIDAEDLKIIKKLLAK